MTFVFRSVPPPWRVWSRSRLRIRATSKL